MYIIGIRIWILVQIVQNKEDNSSSQQIKTENTFKLSLRLEIKSQENG